MGLCGSTTTETAGETIVASQPVLSHRPGQEAYREADHAALGARERARSNQKRKRKMKAMRSKELQSKSSLIDITVANVGGKI